MTVARASKILNTRIMESDLVTYYIGYDLNDDGEMVYRLNEFISYLINIIPEFAFGFHQGTSTSNDEIVNKIYQAAKSIYKIKEFKEVSDLYLSGQVLDDDIEVDKKYLKRGEFGEVILHFILKNFHGTVPLISKVYFKDSYGHAVHGFDSVHINELDRTLWLGESKLYTDGKKGLLALIEDLKEHFKRDYLNDEFTIISNRLKDAEPNEKVDHWLSLLDTTTKLSDQLNKIVIPLICTYSCDLFNQHSDERDDKFIQAYESEIKKIKKYFDDNYDHPLKNHLNIIVILFPVKSKTDLVKGLHKKLVIMQNLGE
ncbi:HamA C-terminal domain-containing protein [Bacillus atrophaeus]